MNILIFGAPGSGKGTQSKNLENYFGIKHISFGDVLRNHVAKKTPIGVKVQDTINRGKLVDSNLMKEILNDQIELAKKEKGVIFDGFPRSVEQAEILNDLFENNRLSLFGIFHLIAPEDCVIDRIKKRAEVEGRKDDQDLEKIKNRLEIYHCETKPVINHYESIGLDVHEINSNRDSEKVFIDLKNKIEILL